MTKQSEKSPEIAFYIGLKNVKKSIEDADLNIGNPGVGGTQYLFLLTCNLTEYLTKRTF